MKANCKPLATSLAAILQLFTIHSNLFTVHAAVPTEWTVRVGPRSAAYQAERRHGDALALKASLVYNGQPLPYSGTARLYAQTNGMGATWWDLAPCTVTSNVLQATWLPSFDTGADVVDLFLGGPSNYQAAARIRFLPSPGAAPNSLPLPVPVLDFAQVTVTNAPFATFEDIASATNDVLQSALRADAQSLSQFAATGTVARALTYGIPTRWTDATGYVWEAQTTRVCTNANEEWTYTMNGQTYTREQMIEAAEGREYYAMILAWLNGTYINKDDEQEEFEGWYVLDGTGTAPVGYDYSTGVIPSYASDPYLAQVTYQVESSSITATRGELVLVTNLVGRVALTNDIPTVPEWAKEPNPPTYSAADVGAAPASLVQAVTNIQVESALVYRLYSGSNVVAEVTNYNSQVHAPELRLMQLNESNEYITVWTETNGLARTLASATAYTDDATNALQEVYAPRAWSRTTSGLGAEAPSNTTWISTPTTVIAGGFEYAKFVDTYGEVWVLTSNGMAAEFNPDTNAYFRITADDGTPVFSIEKSDAQLVGANAAGITVGETTITIPVPVVSSVAPTMYWRASLSSGDWADELSPPTGATVTWSGTAGSWVCTVSFTGTRPSSMFFKFNFLQEGGVVIRNNATTDLSSGIWVNGTKYVPVANGSTLTWQAQ